jgi:adenosylcobinamide-GDP ribazoletransferase
VALMAALPNARSDGLSQSVGRPGRPTTLLATSIAVSVGVLLTGWTAVWIAVALVGLALALGLLAMRKIGGQTGDVLGASQQLADAICLALLAAA